MHISPHCFGATSLTQALQNGLFLPRPTRRSYSFLSDHQHRQKWGNSYVGLVFSYRWQSLNIGSVTGMLLNTGVNEEDEFSKSFPIQGNLLLNFKHYPFPPPLIPKGRFSKQPSDTREKQELQQAWRNRELYQQSRIQCDPFHTDSVCIHPEPGWAAQAAVSHRQGELSHTAALPLKLTLYSALPICFNLVKQQNKTNK